MRILVIAVLALLPISINAKNYFVSNMGNDANRGTSASEPFKTLDHVNTLKLQPGDKILFRKGDVFVGELIIKASGTENKPIVISSYGSGKRPVLTGATPVKGWNQLKDNMYKATISDMVTQVYLGNSYLNIARMPDSGYFFIDEGDRMHLMDKEIESKDNLTGSFVRIQTVNWQWEIRKVIEHNQNQIRFDSTLWHPSKPDFAYYLENKLDFVTQHKEWYYDRNKNLLYIQWEGGNVENADLWAVIHETGIIIDKGATNVIIEDLAIRKYHQSAITLTENASGITISNNDIRDIEVFGILMNRHSRNCKVNDNTISDVLGRGISMLEPQNCEIIGNRIIRTGMIAGHGFDGVNSGVAICMENDETRVANSQSIAQHNRIAYNRIDSTGYGGIRADGAYNIIEYNVVRDAVLTMNDGGGIYCWGNTYDYTHHSIFRKNMVINVHGNTTTSAGNHKIITCMYMDNYSNNNVLEDNILVGAKTGIILNDLSHSHTVKGNKIYDVESGINYSVWMKNRKDSIRGNYHVTNNIIYSKDDESRTINIGNHLDLDNYNIGLLDSNIYVSPVYPQIIKKFTSKPGYQVTYDYEFDTWKEISGKDRHSVAIVPKPGTKFWFMEDNSTIFINDEKVPKVFQIHDNHYYNIQGKKVKGEVIVAPFDAEILYKM